jgi:hypothetical protein
MIDVRKEGIRYFNKHFDLEVDKVKELFDNGIIHESIIIKCLIKEEYKNKMRPKEKQRLKQRLADKYCVSVPLVEKIVANKV